MAGILLTTGLLFFKLCIYKALYKVSPSSLSSITFTYHELHKRGLKTIENYDFYLSIFSENVFKIMFILYLFTFARSSEAAIEIV